MHLCWASNRNCTNDLKNIYSNHTWYKNLLQVSHCLLIQRLHITLKMHCFFCNKDETEHFSKAFNCNSEMESRGAKGPRRFVAAPEGHKVNQGGLWKPCRNAPLKAQALWAGSNAHVYYSLNPKYASAFTQFFEVHAPELLLQYWLAKLKIEVKIVKIQWNRKLAPAMT